MPILRVDFAALDGLAKQIRQTVQELETTLDELDGQIRQVSEVWTGAAAEGFQATVADWRAGAEDLRGQLRFLHDLVSVAHDNHRQAVRTNIAMWRG